MASPVDRGRAQAKSRIVIDVEQLRAERKRRHLGRFHRARKILSIGGLAALLAVVVAVAGAYLWWQSYKKSPSYAVALLIDAAQRDDVRAVEELINSDKIAEGFAPQVTEKLVEGVGAAHVEPMRKQIEGAMPQLLPRVRETMREEIAKGIKDFAAQSGGRMPFGLLALSVARLADVKKDGDSATVDIKEGDRALQLTMQRTPEARWKIVRVKDDVVASDIAARIASALPPATIQNMPRTRPRQRPAAKPAGDNVTTND